MQIRTNLYQVHQQSTQNLYETIKIFAKHDREENEVLHF